MKYILPTSKRFHLRAKYTQYLLINQRTTTSATFNCLTEQYKSTIAHLNVYTEETVRVLMFLLNFLFTLKIAQSVIRMSFKRYTLNYLLEIADALRVEILKE